MCSYDGPYLVIRRSDKHYKIKMKGNIENISIDRLKPSHLDACQNHTPLPSKTETLRTVFARAVRQPARLGFNIEMNNR